MPESWLRRVVRYEIAVAMGAAAGLMLVEESVYRRGEARIEAAVLQVFSSVPVAVAPGTSTIYTGLGTARTMGFDVTSLCTSGILIGGFLAFTAVVLMVRPWRFRALIVALFSTCAIVFAANVVRLSVIIWATRKWGQPGFEISHDYAGTMITLVGLISALVAYLGVLLGGHTDGGTVEGEGSPRRRPR